MTRSTRDCWIGRKNRRKLRMDIEFLTHNFHCLEVLDSRTDLYQSSLYLMNNTEEQCYKIYKYISAHLSWLFLISSNQQFKHPHKTSRNFKRLRISRPSSWHNQRISSVSSNKPKKCQSVSATFAHAAIPNWLRRLTRINRSAPRCSSLLVRVVDVRPRGPS